ncbi:MAG: hypothetical protein ACR650_06515 [Methylocystis sp.]
MSALLAASLALSACLSMNVSSLAPNMIRLNMQGIAAPSDEAAIKETLTLAAQQTLARGYTLFRFTDWTAGPTQIVTPGKPAAANFAVTVVMFRDGEQGTNPFFDARQIVKAP